MVGKRGNSMILVPKEGHIDTRLTSEEVKISSLSSRVSDLEAFSPKLTDGSFAALSFQATALTNCLSQGFLSY